MLADAQSWKVAQTGHLDYSLLVDTEELSGIARMQ